MNSDDFTFIDSWLDDVSKETYSNPTPNFQVQRKDKDVFFSRLLGKEIKVVKWQGPGRCKECAYADFCVNEKYHLLNFRRFEAGRCSARMRDDSENITFKPIKNVYTVDSEFLESLSEVSLDLEGLGEEPEEIAKYQNLLLETYLLNRDESGD